MPTVENLTELDRKLINKSGRMFLAIMVVFIAIFSGASWRMFTDTAAWSVKGIAVFIVFFAITFVAMRIQLTRVLKDGKKLCFRDARITHKAVEAEQNQQATDDLSTTRDYVIYLESERINIGQKDYARFNIGDIVDVEITQVGRSLLTICVARQVNA
jgi:hypothetical protein